MKKRPKVGDRVQLENMQGLSLFCEYHVMPLTRYEKEWLSNACLTVVRTQKRDKMCTVFSDVFNAAFEVPVKCVVPALPCKAKGKRIKVGKPTLFLDFSYTLHSAAINKNATVVDGFYCSLHKIDCYCLDVDGLGEYDMESEKLKVFGRRFIWPVVLCTKTEE